MIKYYPNIIIPKHINKKYIIFDLGQSNASGQGLVDRLLASSSNYLKAPNNISVFKKNNKTIDSIGTWEDLLLGENNDTNLGSFGAEVSLSTNLVNTLKQEIFYIKCTLGGTSLGDDNSKLDWSPNNTNELFDIATKGYFDKGIKYFTNKDIEVLGILWHQGERDAVLGGDYVTNYQSNLSTFVSKLRNYSNYLQNTPFIITKLNFNQTANETTINTAFDNYTSESLNNAFTINISDLPRQIDLTTEQKVGITSVNDDNHQSYIAQVVKGERIYNQLANIYGWSIISESF